MNSTAEARQRSGSSPDRSPKERSSVFPLDLYRSKATRWLLRRPLAQMTIQLILLGTTFGLVGLGLGKDGIPGVPDLHPRMYTHATTLLFWVVWLMGIVFLVPVVGRAWCGVCPVGFFTDLLGRRGLGLRWPRWIASGAGAVGVFVAGLVAVAWLDAHMSPHRTALLIAGALVLAFGVSLVFRRSAFCRGLCPVGAVLHLYARHGPVEVRPVDGGVCRGCADRSCTATRPRWRRWDLGNLVLHRKAYGSGCPVALYPPHMDPAACLLCLRCVRRCSSGNLGVFWGRKARAWPVSPVLTTLLVLVLGLVVVALIRTWPDARLALTPGVAPSQWFSTLWLGGALPAFLILGPYVAAALFSRLGGRSVDGPGAAGPPAPAVAAAPRGRSASAQPFFGAFIGLALGGHAALALVKLNAKAGYLPYLAYDPSGAATYLAIYASRLLPVPDLLIPLSVLRWAAMGCLVLGTLGGVRELWWSGRDASRRGGTAPFYVGSFAVAASLLGAALVHWLFMGRG